MVLRNVHYNAEINLNRAKGQKEIPLFDDIEEVKSDGVKVTDSEKAKNEREMLFGNK